MSIINGSHISDAPLKQPYEIKDNNGIFLNRDVDEMFSMALISSLAIRFVLILHKFVEKRGFRRICLI